MLKVLIMSRMTQLVVLTLSHMAWAWRIRYNSLTGAQLTLWVINEIFVYWGGHAIWSKNYWHVLWD